MATTTNYSWTTPDDTALVKDGAAAIRSLGTAIDTTVFTNAGAAINKTIIDAAGDLIYGTAADTAARLALGTANQVLQVNSGATAPEWVTPVVGGGMTLLTSGTLSGATLNITGIDQTYIDLVMYIIRYDPSVDNEYIRVRVNNDSTASRYAVGAIDTEPSFNQTNFFQGQGYDDTVNYGMEKYTFFRYSESNLNKYITLHKMQTNSSAVPTVAVASHGGYRLENAITEINLFASTGNMGGTYQIYGVK
jgi:hypothetical protein